MDPKVLELYHILNTGTFTYCLICMEDICEKCNVQKEANLVKNHLSCTNHQENVKFLFKLCVPDANEEESNIEDYSDIVRRSVFDISNLLGKKTCYICCKNNHLVCLLCHEEVSAVDFPCKKIKKKVVNHLQSDKHLQSVKDTNWVYHFNFYKSFYRFHKSLLYCSVCKESFQIEDSNLLQFADAHLKNRHTVSYADKGVDKVQAKGDITLLDSVDMVSSSNSALQSSENSAVPPNESSFQPKKPRNYICHLCLGDIEITEFEIRFSIDNHCRSKHLKCFEAQGSSLFKDIICFNQHFLDHKVIVKKYPGIKVLSECVPVFGNNSKYIQIFENICFCRLCSVMVQFDPDPNNLLRNFSAHFHSAEHRKVLKRKGDSGYDKVFKKKNKGLKRLKPPNPKANEDQKVAKKKKLVK